MDVDPRRGTLSAGLTAVVAVAQAVEHLVVVQGVAGSSPVSHPTDGDPRQRRRGSSFIGFPDVATVPPGTVAGYRGAVGDVTETGEVAEAFRKDFRCSPR
jgi:hypothetical protein